jgi:metal-dependent HD superfamily phosphatase/phosphodiesterase
MNHITLNDLLQNERMQVYLKAGNAHLDTMGYTEHGKRHAKLCAEVAERILRTLGYSEREAELAAIAGYFHDVGNVVSRYDHGQTAAIITMGSLEAMGMPFQEVALVVSAIGNHEEEYGHPVNAVAAAMIIADKSDVHRSRVRNKDKAAFDIHDRVNYAVEKSALEIDADQRKITLRLTIDTGISSVMDYFEIFMIRMLMCRRAAAYLNCQFAIYINDSKLL